GGGRARQGAREPRRDRPDLPGAALRGERAVSVADSSLGHVPETPRWEFDEGVTRVFEDMLDRSIPQYRVMRDLVTALGSRALSGGEAKHRGAGQAILDVGCSRGDAVAPFVARFPDLH